MKTEFLQGLGLDKEAIDKIMAENGKDVTAEKNKAKTAIEERDVLQKQLNDAQESLKMLDGVDVDGLKGEIDKLKNDMAAAEANYQKQIAERDFFSMLDTKILAMGGRSTKGIRAELDLDALKESKNQDSDAEAALKALSESHAYYFNRAAETTKTPAKISTGGTHDPQGVQSKPQSFADAIAAHYQKGD